MNPRAFAFLGGASGPWRVERIEAATGETLPSVERLEVRNEYAFGSNAGAAWTLRGVASNERYVSREEKTLLVAASPPPGRPEATRAALIPIRKTESWWNLAQDERRAILEERSEHIRLGLKYLPAVARRLHHGRDLGEPFDFLTWFEFAPENAGAFEELVEGLRATEEWRYVEREVDIRLVRD